MKLRRSRARGPPSRVKRGGRTREGAGAEGHDVRPAPAADEAFAVTQEHLPVGEKVVAKCDRLRSLDMRIARHRVPRVLFTKVAEHLDKGFAADDRFVAELSDDEMVEQAHLVVAGASRV